MMPATNPNTLIKRSVMVVDDDEQTRNYLSRFLTARGFTVECLESGEQAMTRLGQGYQPAVVIIDNVMPGMNGREVLSRAKKMNASIPFIFLSGMGQLNVVVEAMKMGASDYLVKPFEEQELELAIENVLEKQKLKEEVKTLKSRLDLIDEHADFVTANPRMIRLKEICRQVADTDVPVLILGETGVGKEVVARYVHAHSRTHDRNFVKVNCAALPHDLLESELFGYERGAFTGAVGEKPGKFELADHGHILLDEIGEMSPALQAKILHVLQDGEFGRLGGKRQVKVDARVVASTNRVLEDSVARGEFREDLYYRLNVVRLEVPPLRQRTEDIPLLCNLFVQRYRERYKSAVEQFPREILEAFMRYDWPGNVRQFENVVKRYLIMPDLEMVLPEVARPSTAVTSIPQAAPGMAMAAAASGPQPVRSPQGRSRSIKEVAAEAAETAEREMVMRTLDECNWNRKQAARRLGICYKALLNRLKKWKIDSRSAEA